MITQSITFNGCTIQTVNIIAYEGREAMTQSQQEIACNGDIEKIIAQNKEIGHNGKISFYLLETVFNESTMILENLKNLCSAFIDNEEKAGSLPDLALVFISHGYDSLNKVWDKVMEEYRKTQEAPTTEPDSEEAGAKE